MAKEEDAQRIAKNYVRRLARSITVRQAILTGSRATGSYLEDSDVDLIIVSDDFSKMKLPERLKYLQKQWKSKIPLEAFGYTVNEFATLRRKSTYVKEAVRTGIALLDSRGRIGNGILLKPGLTTADLAGSGKKHSSVTEMKLSWIGCGQKMTSATYDTITDDPRIQKIRDVKTRWIL